MTKNKKILVIAIMLSMTIAIGAVFAQAVCNYYESGTEQVTARISVDGRTATIDVKSYVGRERIEIYRVVVNGVEFTNWDIRGNCEIGPHGSTTVSVTKTGSLFPSNPSFKVYLKTCE
jgi:pyrrolidone-carboxylate peptidase